MSHLKLPSLRVHTPAVVSCTSPKSVLVLPAPVVATSGLQTPEQRISRLLRGVAVLGCDRLLTVVLEPAGNGCDQPRAVHSCSHTRPPVAS